MAITPTVAAIIAAGGVERYAVAEGIDPGAMCRAVHRLRAVYDFEFWCISCVKIFDKTSGRLVPFKLRWAQLKLVRILLCDLFAGKPVRIVLLKARQWGGSTVVQMFMAWIQLFHRSGWNSVIVADVEDQARTIRAMYSRMARRHPVEICSVQFCNFEGSSKNKMLVDRDCVVSIGSMQKPDSLRSGDMKMAHLSEVGLWKKTKERKPEDVIQTILGSVPREPFTVVVLESTAKGIGNFFHDTWCEAVDGRSAYTPLFVAWYEIDIYYKPFVSERQKTEFVHSMTRDELARFHAGATLEGLNWYREKRREYSTDWQMCSEFPSTAEEAFQTTLARSFLVSADNAHAIHPDHPEYADADNCPRMNKGVVIKFNANQHYATDGRSCAVFRAICTDAGVPVQVMANRSDLPGGSTLGCIAGTLVPVSTVDIGLPQLAMHAAWETMGIADCGYLADAMARCFETEL